MRRMACGLSLVICLLAGACGSSGATQNSSSCSPTNPKPAANATALRFSTLNTSPTFYFNQALLDWQKLVLKQTNCQLYIQPYFNTLGIPDEPSQINDIKTGLIDGAADSTAVMANFYAPLGVLDLYFLFSGYDQLAKVLEGPLGKRWAAGVDSSTGLKVISFWSSGFFQLGTASKKVATPDDLKGLKVRTLQAPVPIAYMNALGANATPLGSTQVYTALQAHLLDGTGTNWGGLADAKQYEVLKYVTQLNFEAQGAVLSMNKSKFNSLPANFQRVLMDTAKTATANEFKYVVASDASGRKTATSAGVQVITPTADQLKLWQAKARAEDAQWAPKFGQNTIDQILNTK